MNTYDVIQLNDINLSQLKLVKETYKRFGNQDHSRWVFRTQRTDKEKKGLFFKIWNPTYIRRDHLIRGIEAEFYDETTVPAFQAMIFAKGICRGYVMRECLPNRRKDPVFHSSILEKTTQTGFFHVQYSRFHTLRYDEKLSLVDLEGIHPLVELPLMSSCYHCFFDDMEYERFVADLYCRKFPHLDVPESTKQSRPSNFLLRQILYPYRKVRSLYQDLYRRLSIRLGTIFNHIERIEY
ncbi:MAG: hypothetical protein ACXW4M_07780 [Anaerolineales bacterium]